MDPRDYQYRARWTEHSPGAPSLQQSHRFRTLEQAQRFVGRLLGEQPRTRIILERRVAYVGPWERIDHGGER